MSTPKICTHHAFAFNLLQVIEETNLSTPRSRIVVYEDYRSINRVPFFLFFLACLDNKIVRAYFLHSHTRVSSHKVTHKCFQYFLDFQTTLEIFSKVMRLSSTYFKSDICSPLSHMSIVVCDCKL